mgnify:CR=1 FL=1
MSSTAPTQATSGLSSSLASLSDPQVKEIQHLFNYMDNDKDGRICPAAAQKLCEMLGFATELEGMPPSVSLGDMLAWCNHYHTQCERSAELKLTQVTRSATAFRLPHPLRRADLPWLPSLPNRTTQHGPIASLRQRFSLLAGPGVHRLTRQAMDRFLREEGHIVNVRPPAHRAPIPPHTVVIPALL